MTDTVAVALITMIGANLGALIRLLVLGSRQRRDAEVDRSQALIDRTRTRDNGAQLEEINRKLEGIARALEVGPRAPRAPFRTDDAHPPFEGRG
jgi:hypothetical protein